MAREAVFCSWSGGKDSALALHEAVLAGAEPRFLVSMLTEGGARSRSHGLPREVLAAQAEALGLPIHFGVATWDDYRAEFVRVVADAVAATGARVGVFGDINTEAHREWEESVCADAGARALLPLWRRDPGTVATDVLAAGFEAVIVAVRDGILPPDLLGRTLDHDLLTEIEAAGADPCGENGEFHTLVVDGPPFTRRLTIEPGQTVLRDGVWFLDLGSADAG